jgi:pimeloyl-ACP methyl ester carboxylesterase
MGNRRRRDPSLLLASWLVGGLAGAIAAARGPSVWLGVVFGLAVAGLLTGVDVVSRVLIEKRRLRAEQLPQPEATPEPVNAMQESAPMHGPESNPAPERVPEPEPAKEPVPIPGAEAKLAALPEPVSARPVNAVTTASKSVAVVFIHGLLSSASVWESFCQLIKADAELAGLEIRTFEYPTPVAEPNPLRRIPDFDMLGRLLGTYLEEELAEFRSIVLVTHSQGGLVAQRHIALELNGGGGRELARIKRLIMFACPNSGSELAITLRRLTWFWRHPQERQLRPLNAQVNEAHRILTNQVIHARKVTAHDCPIDISVYAGAQDNVVTLASALSVFPHKQTGVLPGDHFTIIQPDSASHLAYLALRKKLLALL